MSTRQTYRNTHIYQQEILRNQMRQPVVGMHLVKKLQTKLFTYPNYCLTCISSDIHKICIQLYDFLPVSYRLLIASAAVVILILLNAVTSSLQLASGFTSSHL